MLVSLAAMILLTICLGSDTSNSNAFNAKNVYGQVMSDVGQVKQDSDFNADAKSINLTGTWNCDDGGRYYTRQIGNAVAWLGESSDGSRSSIAFGRISGSTVNLNWMDVKGDGSGSGSLTLGIESNDKMTLIQETGGFIGTEWTRPPTYQMSDLKMTGKTAKINASSTNLLPKPPSDLFRALDSGKPSSGIERVSLNPQPEPPVPPEPFETQIVA